MLLRRSLRAATTIAVAVVVASGLPLPAAEPAGPSLHVDSVELTGPDPAGALVAGTATDVVEAAAAGVAEEGFAAAVAMPNDGEMVVLEWDEPVGPVTFELRSRNAEGWSDWVHLAADPSEAPDDEGEGPPTTAGPVWVGAGTVEVEVRVEHGSPAGLVLHALDSVEPEPTGGFGRIAGATAAPPNPGIRPNTDWATGGWRPDNPGCEDVPQEATRLRYAIVHHSVTTNSYSADLADDLLRGIYWQHVNANGWCDIAYNLIVDRHGQIWEGRSGGIDRAIVGGHARGFNTGSTGVLLLGQYQPGASPPAAPVPAVQRTALRRALAWKLGVHGIDPGRRITVTSGCSSAGGYNCLHPSGRPVLLPTITSHRAVSRTSCPGDYAESQLAGLRREVAFDVVTSQAWPLTGWRPASSGPELYTLDAFGGVHPAGNAAVPSAPSTHWGSWNIARGIAARDSSGYVLDGWGGLHSFGGAPPRAIGNYWPWWDIARDVALGPLAGSGYVLDGFGGVHTFGNAIPLESSSYWQGWDIANAVAVGAAGLTGYVLDGFGGLHPLGSAPPRAIASYWHGWDIARDVALRADGTSGYVLDGWGGVHPFGGAPAAGITWYAAGYDVARSLVLNSSGDGGWVLDADGYLHPFGNASVPEPYTTWVGFGIGRGVGGG